MAGEGFQIGLQIGDRVGSAIKNGVAEWREIQRERQERKEFEGALQVDEQRRLRLIEETTPQTRPAYEQAKSMLRKYPQAERIERPIPGAAREDGSLELEEVIRTPEGEIPVSMLEQFDVNEREAFFRRQKAETDRILQFQARLPENRFAKQYVAGQFAGLQREQQLFLTKFKAKQQEVELYTARANLERAQLERQRLQGEDQRLAAADTRAREFKTFETNERVRGDLAIAEGKAKFEKPAEPKLSKGAEARDVAFARDVYTPLVSEGGFADVEKSLGQLDEIIQELRKTDSATGPVVGNLPDMARTVVADRSVALEDQVGEIVQKNLKLILGGQFAQKEAEALLKRSYNVALKESENIARLTKLRGRIQKAYDQQRTAAQYFEQKGTLEGFKGGAALAPGAGAPSQAAGAAGAPDAGAGASVAPPVAPEFAQDAADIRRALREGRITRDEAVRRIAEMGGQ